MTSLPNVLARTSRAVQIGLALSLATAATTSLISAPAQAKGRHGGWRTSAEALSKLSPADRRGYFEGVRSLDRRRFDQRQEDLRAFEACLGDEQETECVDSLRSARAEQRKQWRKERQALLSRYNLPVRSSQHRRAS
jgi:hypothetical protein